MPSRRTDFLIRQGWEPVQDRSGSMKIPVTMWRDPLYTENRAGYLERRVLWPHEAENLARRRIRLVLSIMDG